MENPIIWLILTILNLYFWMILAMVIMSWLIGFNIINGSNPYVRQISYALRRLTEPFLGPIRRLPARPRWHRHFADHPDASPSVPG